MFFEFSEKKSEIHRLESCTKQLTEELTQAKITNENLGKTLEDAQNQNKVYRETCCSIIKCLYSIESFHCAKSFFLL